MSRIAKLTAEFKKTKAETACLILAVTVMILSSPAYAEVEREYYYSGQLMTEWNYKDDKREGIAKVYYENGQLKQEANYKDGKREGIVKGYYESGQLGWEKPFKNGKEEGMAKEYYWNGGIKYIDTYKNGTKINRKMYDERGKLEFDTDYPTE